MEIARAFILRESWLNGNSPGRNFLLSGGDKNNLRDMGFFAIIKVGMNQSLWLILGWQEFLQAEPSRTESALSALGFTNSNRRKR
jgi:hypothetical protein